MTWPLWFALILCSMAIATFGLVVYGSRRWTDASRSLTARLEAGRVSTSSMCYDSRELEGLPAPVQRYFLPWAGSWSDYQTRDAMIVPFTGEAAWLRPEGRKPYFHGSVTTLICEFSP